MDSTHVAKLLSLYARGVITLPELANSILVDLVGDDSPGQELISFVAGLPDDVQGGLMDLLREIRMKDYRWKPFVIGPGGNVLGTEADDAARLRELCAALGAQATAARHPASPSRV